MKISKAIIILFISAVLYQNSIAQWQYSEVEGNIKAVYFSNSKTGYIVNGGGPFPGGISKTIDGGISWFIIGGKPFVEFTSVFFFGNANTGYACTADSKIYKTTNAGTNWIENYSGYPRASFYKIFFNTSDYGYACGYSIDSGSVVCKTTNAGLSWNIIKIPGGGTNTNSHFYSVNTFFLVGGTAFSMTTNGGTNWTTKRFLNADLKTVYFINPSTGYIAGVTNSSVSSLVLKTTDGGLSWIDKSPPTVNNTQVYSICFPRLNPLGIGFIAGRLGGTYPNFHCVYKTTNGGENWSNTNYTSSNNALLMTDMFFWHLDTGWAVGGYAYTGAILRTLNGGVNIKPINGNIPDRTEISQNFPNPFNPTTKINFSLLKAAVVSIIIYDASGKEIFTLVNEALQQGEYESNWDASSFPSGAYFYKISAGDFTETKKMLLIK